ncbi:hypothetical protein NL676_035383 [Syzygium grande]|nr:hypothetical protein NL676_035383 [Syzygium grande]
MIQYNRATLKLRQLRLSPPSQRCSSSSCHRRMHLNSIPSGCEQCPRLARSPSFDSCCRCSDKELLSEITTAKVSPQQPTGAVSSRFSSESPPAPLQVPNVIYEPNQPISV